MASNDHDLDDLDLDDLDLPDLDFGDLDGTDAGKRKPVERISDGTLKGIRGKLLSSGTRSTLIRSALPKGYSDLESELSDLVGFSRDLYDSAAGHLAPVKEQTKRIARRGLSATERFLPKRLSEKLKSLTEPEEQQRSTSQHQQRRDEITLALGEIFGTQHEYEKAKDKEREAHDEAKESIEAARSESMIENLMAIRRQSARQLGFQDKITAGFMRKSLELQFQQYHVARDHFTIFQGWARDSARHLDAIRTNTALPEFVKLRTNERAKQMIMGSVLGGVGDSINTFTSNFRGNIANQIKGKVSGAASGMAMGIDSLAMGMESMADIPIDKAEMGGTGLGALLGEFIVSQGSGLLHGVGERSDKVRKVGADIEYGISNYRQIAESQIRKRRKDSEEQVFEDDSLANRIRAGFWGMAQDALPVYNPEATFGLKTVNMQREVATYNTLADRSIVEVIPGLLTEILHEAELIRRGESDEDAVDRRVYSHERGGIIGRDTVISDVQELVFPKTSLKAMQRSVDSIVDSIDPQKELSKDARAAFSRQILIDAANDNEFNIERYAGKDGLNTIKDPGLVEQIQAAIINQVIDDSGSLQDTLEAKELRNTMSREFHHAASQMGSYNESIARLMPAYGKDVLRRTGMVYDFNRRGEFRTDIDGLLDVVNNRGWDPAAPEPEPDAPTKPKMRSYKDRLKDRVVGSQFSERMTMLTKDPKMPDISGVMPALKGRASQAGDSLRGYATTTQDKLKGHLDKVETWVKDKVQPTRTELNKVIDSISTYAQEVGDTDLQAKANEIKDTLSTTISNEYSNDRFKDISKSVSDLTEKVKDSDTTAAVKSHVERASQAVQDEIRLKVGDETKLKATSWFARMKDSIRSGTSTAREKATDIYVRGRAKASLYKDKLQQGFYKDQKTGDPIYSEEDIKGPVVDADNNVVLSEEDLKGTLTDAAGKPKHGLMRRLAGGLASGWWGLSKQYYNTLGKVTSSLWSAGRWTVSKVAGWFSSKDEDPDYIGDVYLKGDDEPIMTKKDLMAGRYVNARSEETVYRLEDIDGAVKDKTSGDTVITEEQIKDNVLVDKRGKSVGAFLKKAIKNILLFPFKGYWKLTKLYYKGLWATTKFAGRAVLGIAKFIGRRLGIGKPKARDVYVAGEESPRLVGVVMKNGGYVTSKGKSISVPEKINGSVYNLDGEVILSEEDIKNGLVDSKGKTIETKFTKEPGFIGRALGTAKDWVKSKFSNLRSRIFGTKVEADPVKEQEIEMQQENNDTLSEVRDILDERLDKKSSWNDSQGDGIRDGSWRERLQSGYGDSYGQYGPEPEGDDREHSFADREQSLISTVTDTLLAGLKGVFGKLLAFLGLSKAAGAAGGLLGGGRRRRGRGSRLGRAARGAGALAMGAGRLAWRGTKALGRGARIAGRFARGAAVRGALTKAGVALAGVVSAPVALTALAVGAVAVGGYLLYRRYTNRPASTFDRVRFIQYGVQADDKENRAKMLALEGLLEKHIDVSGDTPQLSDDLNPDDLLEAVGLNGEDEGAGNQFGEWFVNRFKPVYLSHVSVANTLAGTTDLKSVEKTLSKPDKLAYLQQVRFSEDLDESPMDHMEPFFEGMDTLPGRLQVERIHQASIKELQDSVGTSNASSDDSKDAVTSQSSVNRNPAMQARIDQAYKRRDATKDRYHETTGQITQASTHLSVKLPDDEIGTIKPFEGKPSTILNARMKIYGLRSMDPVKIGQLKALERYIENHIHFKGSVADLDVSSQHVYRQFGAVFGMSVNDEVGKRRWIRWFTLRFMPVLITAYRQLKALNKSKNVEQLEQLSDEDMLSVIYALQRTINSEGMSVWQLGNSPWPDYQLNDRSDSISEQQQSLHVDTPSETMSVDHPHIVEDLIGMDDFITTSTNSSNESSSQDRYRASLQRETQSASKTEALNARQMQLNQVHLQTSGAMLDVLTKQLTHHESMDKSLLDIKKILKASHKKDDRDEPTTELDGLNTPETVQRQVNEAPKAYVSMNR